jgi:hypothetical protein
VPRSQRVEARAIKYRRGRELDGTFTDYRMGLRFHTPTINGQSTEDGCGSMAAR